ncbi:lipocalin-15-like isoform X2 [Dipodomys merriami]|uniref:lipocalin-15-like isoform X2 n=1 Tax=Dipodomys merriami TaxID=94247 RepID=UPI00384B7D4B
MGTLPKLEIRRPPITIIHSQCRPAPPAQFSGLWYVVAMVSDCQVFLGTKDHLLMSSSTINATAEGDLSAHMVFPGAEGCIQVDADYLRVGSEGHFQVPVLHYLDVRVAETDYSSFAVLYISKELVGALSTTVKLYSRTQDPTPEALRAFRDFYPTVGLQDDMMILLPKSGQAGGRRRVQAAQMCLPPTDMCSPREGGTPAPPEAQASPSQESTGEPGALNLTTPRTE